MNPLDQYRDEAVLLLQKMITIPSYSFQEGELSDYLFSYLERLRILNEDKFSIARIEKNILLYHNGTGSNGGETLMITAHIDTVKEAESYSVNPFGGEIIDGKIFGLGSNDDGGCVVCAIYAFLSHLGCKLHDEKTAGEKESHSGEGTGPDKKKINIVVVLSTEEERSGNNGMSLVVKKLEESGISPDYAIVGEPTGMMAAVAERGLLVIDAVAHGVSGHAARNEGVNALYTAVEDIQKLRNYSFDRISPTMGEVKLTVTQINGGTVHNVIPDKCTFVVDIRPTDRYTNPEIMELLRKEVRSDLIARNLTNKSSATPTDSMLMHIIEQAGFGKFVSPTTSDWMRIPYPAIKIGPGESSRSHRADEFITIAEIEAGIKGYLKIIELLEKRVQNK